MDFVTSALIVSWAAILLLALVVSGLIRQVHQLSKEVGRGPSRVGVAPGSAAPDAADLLGGDGGVLLFVSRGCRTCVEAVDEAAAWRAELGADAPAIHAVYAGDAPPDSAVPASGERPDLFDRYDAIATPFAVVVDETGRVSRSEPVGSRTAVRDVLKSVRVSQSRSTS